MSYALSFVIFLFLAEVIMRGLLTPSPYCSGKIFNLEIGPCKPRYYDIPEDYALTSESIPPSRVKGLIGIKLDDLMGAYEDSPVLTSSVKENYRSANGWWQTNNIGARRREDATPTIPYGYRRILTIGESYTNCRGVKQEESWPYLLEKSLKNTEILNFGVNGFSMTLSYLRFAMVTEKIDYDMVIFVFSPSEDLYRETVVSSCLIKWTGCRPDPRFVIENDQLTLIKSPYADRAAYYADNKGTDFSPTMKAHLKKYSAFYFPLKFEKNPVLGHSVLFRALASLYTHSRTQYIFTHLSDPDSEAFKITKKIFEKADQEARKKGKKFVLVFLPTSLGEVKDYKTKKNHRASWSTIITKMCEKQIACLDLMHDFQQLPPSEFDTAYDGTHFGPKMNNHIAESIYQYLLKTNN